jgi:hypothetical protein
MDGLIHRLCLVDYPPGLQGYMHGLFNQNIKNGNNEILKLMAFI